VHITTNVVSSHPARGEVYSIQHYVIKFVSDLQQVGGFLHVLRFPSSTKTDRYDVTEILLKVALNNIKLNLLLDEFLNRIYFENMCKLEIFSVKRSTYD
jgi:hypothetical protein